MELGQALGELRLVGRGGQAVEAMNQPAFLVEDMGEDVQAPDFQLRLREDFLHISRHLGFAGAVPPGDDVGLKQLDNLWTREGTPSHERGLPSAVPRVQVAEAVGDDEEKDWPLLLRGSLLGVLQ